jgi:dTDP-4-amino-4,6-dideoxygalactose transaminase
MTKLLKNIDLHRPEIEMLTELGYEFDQTWQVNHKFETKVAEFFGSRYAISLDSCTHALELCFRWVNQLDVSVEVPVNTYMSVPMMLTQLKQSWHFVDSRWQEYYDFNPLPIIDAAYTWRTNSYVPGSYMCISFQFKKHICIGHGGMILTDDVVAAEWFQRMCRDGRNPQLKQDEDDIIEMGYHYSMIPEDAARGILLMDKIGHLPAKVYGWDHYKTLTKNQVFKNHPVL